MGFEQKGAQGHKYSNNLGQITCKIAEPLFLIFLDLKKAYDMLDRSQSMRIMEGYYGVGAASICRILDSSNNLGLGI